MSYNIICSLPKEYDTPSERFIKTSGNLDITKEAFVTTTETVAKEGNTDMVDKVGKLEPNVVEEAITPPIAAKKN